MDCTSSSLLACPVCSRVHRRLALRRGERAFCATCGSLLARRQLTADAPLAFTLTALILAIPAMQLPIVVVRKFGAEHASYLWTGIRALWRTGMPLLSVWVTLCGLVVPLALIATLTTFVVSSRQSDRSRSERFWMRTAHALQHWSMPEVQVLAVLVAFVKIGVLVNVNPGPGLWCYAGMTVALLFAWRSAELHEVSR